MKKRSKKYNPRKTFSLKISRAVFISFESESEKGDAVCVTNIANPALRDAVVEFRTNWFVHAGAVLFDGKEYYTEEQELIGKQCRLNDLTETYRQAKRDILGAVNHNHLVDFGWIIRPHSPRVERNQKPFFDTWLERAPKRLALGDLRVKERLREWMGA